MERNTVDYSLYYVTGRLQLSPGADYYENLEQACAGGVTIVQLREKNITTREFVELARKSKAITDKYNIPLLINDRLDIALAVPGCGLHVGQSDMPATLARKLLGPDVIIGVSTNASGDIETVIEEGVADYIGIGPVHFTSSKDVLAPILGPRGIREMLGVLGESGVKAVAIGGISESTIDNLMRQSPAPLSNGLYRHLDGVAVISVMAASLTPKLVAQRLLASVKTGQALYPSLSSPAPTIDSILDIACRQLATLRSGPSPLIHHITNLVVQNDSANLTLALHASPICSGSAQEADELSQVIGALLINFGTISDQQIKAMLTAGTAANRNGKPIVFDPVGVGATTYRREGAQDMLNSVHFSIIKGNAGEIGALAGSDEVKARGVDSVGEGFQNPGKLVRDLARKEKLIVAMSGVKDYISDGRTVVSIENGHHWQSVITGSGCMASTSVAVFTAIAEGDNFSAAVSGLLCINVAAEIAAERSDVKGPNSFRTALIDECYNLTPESLRARARIAVV